MKKKLVYYVPGVRPNPMIMMFNKHDKNVFDEKYNVEFGQWDENLNSYWTMNAYLLHNDKEVKAFKYNEFANFVWLLRSLNKPFEIEVDEKTFEEIKKDYINEFKWN